MGCERCKELEYRLADARTVSDRWAKTALSHNAEIECFEKRFALARETWDKLCAEVPGLSDAASVQPMLEALSGVRICKPSAEEIERVRRELDVAGTDQEMGSSGVPAWPAIPDEPR